MISHDSDKLTRCLAATVETGSHQDTFYDTAGNCRAFSFLIRCYYPLSSGRDQSARTRLCAVIDEVIATLEQNVTMPGVWENARPSRVVWDKDERAIPV